MELKEVLMGIIFAIVSLVVFFVLLPVIFNNLTPIVTNNTYSHNYGPAISLFQLIPLFLAIGAIVITLGFFVSNRTQ